MESDEKTITILEQGAFPPLLREIADPPKQLFIRGALPDQAAYRYLAVVGSRACSPYGKDVCETLIRGLAGYPVAIVSGLALGIDGCAHRAALAAGLPTVAVPGSGLGFDVLYPSAHHDLARKIVGAGGALLSEFDEHFEATPWSFPKRNRLMAGMSHAVLVIEAGEKSGTLITARLAADYNRDLLVVPSSIFSGHAKGSNELLRQGATAVTSSEHILEALRIEPREKENVARVYEGLSPDEQRVVELLREPQLREELLEALSMPVREAHIVLGTLEVRGIIAEREGMLRLL